MPLRLLGLLGGTFDPIHNGHLQMALELQRRLGLEELRLLPNRLPPHKPGAHADGEQRLAMVRQACAPYPQLSVDDRELRRHQPSYTVDTLEQLRQEHPDESICFIIGMDSLASFDRWYLPQRILELANLVVCRRHGVPAPDLGDFNAAVTTDARALRRHRRGQILLTDLEPVGLSSTAIRTALAQGQLPRDHLPPAVADYIAAHGLYGHGVAPNGRV
ncbi:nicotinate-nucleotide adenylyltransferase [Ferrimonas sediminicola]|uniref:Probable nicotinate-nucleotide adenylyltransferase n=1 Tax=Ferrimonas sediminicola TaxID=2569538 RepID=A0A4V5NV87_9GAMM|nr:nicotinate-nucleotide adenylyltransferase [Ferrimonas sediminicola]TKB49484.1 nicotinate-nucleotide adenylyltransferase [Ferrimonas sediminicola]